MSADLAVWYVCINFSNKISEITLRGIFFDDQNKNKTEKDKNDVSIKTSGWETPVVMWLAATFAVRDAFQSLSGAIETHRITHYALRMTDTWNRSNRF